MSDTAIYSGSQILDTWVNHDWTNGLQLESVPDLSEIHVTTRNSIYEITVIDGFARKVLVRGGRFFPQKTPADLAGSSLGGGFLKLGGVYAGFCLEFVAERNTVITTRVRSIRVFKPPTD